MILDDICKELETQGILTVGANLYLGNMPLKTQGVVAYNGVSDSPNVSIGVFYQTLDFWSKYKSHQTAYQKLLEIQDYLHRKANYETDNYHIYLSHSLGSIEDMDMDAEKNKMYKLSVRFIYREL